MRAVITQLQQGQLIAQAKVDAFMMDVLADTTGELLCQVSDVMQDDAASVSLLLGMVRYFRERMRQVNPGTLVCDVVGTGGDGYHTYNVSTAAALLAAACGVKVAKHGNRAVSSCCGSADVLAALGYDIEAPAAVQAQLLQRHGFAFFYAPSYHPGFLQFKSIRKKIKKPTIFNLLGPLLNPAGADCLLLGVCSKRHQRLLAQVLVELSVQHAWVCCYAGCDELVSFASQQVCEVRDGRVSDLILDVTPFAFKSGGMTDLVGGDVQTNLLAMRAVFAGEASVYADTVILNAAVCCYLSGRVTSVIAGIALARRILHSGEGLGYLTALLMDCQKIVGVS